MNDVNKDAGGGNRTPTTYRSTDFHTRHGFRRRQRRLESGLSLHHGPKALGATRLVSTPSPGRGLARDCRRPDRYGFPEFERFYSSGFPKGTPSKSAASTSFATPACRPSSRFRSQEQVMASRRYTLADVVAAVAASTSIRQVLDRLGLASQGGGYTTIHRLIEKHGLNTSHFTGQAWNRGLTGLPPRRPLTDYLVENCPHKITSNALRRRLITAKIFDHRCSNCHLAEWLGGPIPLELEHRNGRRDDNRLGNLCLLCPNCHALTATYRGRNQKRARIHGERNPDEKPIGAGQREIEEDVREQRLDNPESLPVTSTPLP